MDLEIITTDSVTFTKSKIWLNIGSKTQSGQFVKAFGMHLDKQLATAKGPLAKFAKDFVESNEPNKLVTFGGNIWYQFVNTDAAKAVQPEFDDLVPSFE